MNRNILCIDLKSFFAACECVDRGLDIFTTPLVVADPARGDGAITLAVTPKMKEYGVKSRGRIFEIPKNIKYLRVKPRMSLYVKKSAEVVNIYLDFINSQDMHIYSIDEVFLDVTDYLKMYKTTDYELAKKIMKTVELKTGLYATCGIGPNMLLAKVSMDIEAKHTPDCIAKWSYNDVPTKLFSITPLSKMWGIGSRLEKRLNNLGIHSVGDLANYNVYKLKEQFGIIGEELHNHANGIDNSRIKDLKVEAKEKSFGHSQILFKDYNSNNIKIIISEMIDVLARRLRENHKQTGLVAFGIGYSKEYQDGFYHSVKLDAYTDNEKEILKVCLTLFNNYYNGLPIRKVSISLGKLHDKNGIQLNLFESFSEVNKNDKIKNTVDEITNKFGKNSILKASSLLEDSTIQSRNNKIGGHSA